LSADSFSASDYSMKGFEIIFWLNLPSEKLWTF